MAAKIQVTNEIYKFLSIATAKNIVCLGAAKLSTYKLLRNIIFRNGWQLTTLLIRRCIIINRGYLTHFNIAMIPPAFNCGSIYLRLLPTWYISAQTNIIKGQGPKLKFQRDSGQKSWKSTQEAYNWKLVSHFKSLSQKN